MRTVTGVYGNAIVRVHFPDITPEERERRIEHEVKPALAKFGRAAYERGFDLEAWSANRHRGRRQQNADKKRERSAE